MPLSPYRELKVKILNGAHTMLYSIGLLTGKNTVYECMQDDQLRLFIMKGIYQDILPILDISVEEKKNFADSVIERFLNPSNHHQLIDMAVHAVQKFRIRLMPTLLSYAQVTEHLPTTLCFSFASMLALYQKVFILDDAPVMMRDGEGHFFKDDLSTCRALHEIWQVWDGREENLHAIVSMIFAHEEWWGLDLRQVNHLGEMVLGYLKSILDVGMDGALARLMGVGK